MSIGRCIFFFSVGCFSCLPLLAGCSRTEVDFGGTEINSPDASSPDGAGPDEGVADDASDASTPMGDASTDGGRMLPDGGACPPGTVACGTTCVNLSSNPSHCGGCGV